MHDRKAGSPWLIEKDGNLLFNFERYPELIRECAMEVKPEIRKRALRRYHAKRKKAWVRRTLRHYFMNRHELPERRVGMYFHTPKVCSCFMCGNPRRFHSELTVQERRAIHHHPPPSFFTDFSLEPYSVTFHALLPKAFLGNHSLFHV